MAEPNPTEVSPWYLRNITQALELNEDTGQVFVRTGFTGNIVISGNVNIPGNVDAHISEIGTSGNLTVPWMPVSIDGNSNVTISGGNVNAAVSGTVTVSSITSNVTIVDGGGSITVDGSVGITGTVNANITGGNVTVAQGTDPWVVSGNVNATLSSNANVIISGFSGATSDAFGRLRVSEPFTLFDSQARYYDHGQFDSSIAGGGSVVYVANQSSFQLNVGTANGDSVIRETKRVFPYQPGKSQLTLNTFCMATPKTNLRQRVGLFGANDGVFFENDGQYNYMVIRSGSTGQEERVRQDAWNGDRLNGLGGVNNPSGITLYPQRTQIFWADVEWLGVGTVRTGFIIDGKYYICHSFNHANQIGNTKVYMTTANLPIRYEITNTGATASASQMVQICSSVISEGGYTDYGITEAAGTGITPKRLSDQNTYYPIISIRLASGRLDSIVLPTQLDFLSTSVNYYQFKLLLNPTLTGATWTGTSETGSVQFDTGATSFTGGTQIQSGFVSARSSVELSALSFFQFQLGRTIAGVSDVLTLVMASTSPNADILAQLGWQELT